MKKMTACLHVPELAQRDLDADWVVLSACNAAGGHKNDAEALSDSGARLSSVTSTKGAQKA